jgi:hypothetical protein
MLPPVLTKYGFRIRTRVGLIISNLMIHGRDPAEAQRKLRQMYRDCEIIECVCHRGGVRTPVVFDEPIQMLARGAS